MPHRRPKSKVTGLAVSILLTRYTAAAGFDGSNNVALYWGQNSYNQGTGKLAQQSLATYCANTDVDIIPMAFLVQITSGQGGLPVINFANQGNNCTMFPNSQLLDCPSIGDDIKTCQQKYNKTILLSIGGATYTEGGFESKDAAVSAANMVWQIFGPASGSSATSSTITSSGSAAGTASTGLTSQNTTALAGSAHSTAAVNVTRSALTTGATGHVAANVLTRNASTTIPVVLSTGIGLNTTSVVKGKVTNSTIALTKSSTVTSNADVLTLVATFVTTLSEPTTQAHTTNGLETADAVSAASSRSTKTLRTTAKIDSAVESTASTSSIASFSEVSRLEKNELVETPKSHAAASSPLSTRTLKTTGKKLHTKVENTETSKALTKADTAKASEPTSMRSSKHDKPKSKDTAEAKSSASAHHHLSKTHKTVHKTLSEKHSSKSLSTSAPKETAETLDYATTHPKRDASATRPFHDAVIDGFDLDLETSVQNFNSFANQLRTLMDGDTSKKYYLTAAPQCPYPDAADDSMLNGGAGVGKVKFDAVFVQFYNNYCGTNSFTPNSTTQNTFNYDTWDKWATTKSANPNVKVFLGVPAGQSAAGTGYMAPDGLAPIIEYCKTFASFGGVMMWDASQAYANDGFLSGVKGALTSVKRRARMVRRKVEREWWG